MHLRKHECRDRWHRHSCLCRGGGAKQSSHRQECLCHQLAVCGLLALMLAIAPGCKSDRANASAQLRHDTEQARTGNNQAYQLIQQGKFDDAEKTLKHAITADVMYGPARNNLGLVYYHQGRLYEAAWEFQNAAKLMPYQPEPRNNLGLVFERAGKMTDAADAYDHARQLEPDNPEFLGNLARAKVRRGDTDEQTRHLLEELVMKD